MPIVLNELEKLGVYEDIEKAGIKNEQGITFRKSHAKGSEVLARLQMSQIPVCSKIKSCFVCIFLTFLSERGRKVQLCRYPPWTASTCGDHPITLFKRTQVQDPLWA